MNLVSEKNLSNFIIYIFISIMSVMIFSISYFYVKNTYNEFDVQVEEFVQKYYEDKRKTLKKELNTIIDILNYIVANKDEDDEKLKKDAVRLLNNITFEQKKSNYFFVYDIKKIQGGDDFARMIVNPNRPDLLGKLISTNYKDNNGKKFREKFLRDIRENGESFTQYAYKKPGLKNIKQKLSYFKLYENWNWIISVGIYIDDIEKEISHKKEVLKKKIRSQILQNIVLFIMFLSLAILISFIISRKIDNLLLNYKKEVKQKAYELEQLNANLENRVEEEIKKSRKKEQLLIEKSKFIALGEMISNIAHQWRQPLCELSSILMFIRFKYSVNALDKKTMDTKSIEADKVIEYMSKTIDDFRNFFMPKKSKNEFYIYQAVDMVMNIILSSLKNNNIKIELNIDKKLKIYTYKNEYEQVLLNIINNARDILIQNNIKEPKIKIQTEDKKDCIILSIEDNAGGIDMKIIDKIFEPYFTTKAESNGTGIGLYMSKIIVEKNMKGTLAVKNIKDGAKFEIIIFK